MSERLKKLTAAKDNEQAALVAKREAEVAARMALNAERIKEEERKKKAAEDAEAADIERKAKEKAAEEAAIAQRKRDAEAEARRLREEQEERDRQEAERLRLEALERARKKEADRLAAIEAARLAVIAEEQRQIQLIKDAERAEVQAYLEVKRAEHAILDYIPPVIKWEPHPFDARAELKRRKKEADEKAAVEAEKARQRKADIEREKIDFEERERVRRAHEQLKAEAHARAVQEAKKVEHAQKQHQALLEAQESLKKAKMEILLKTMALSEARLRMPSPERVVSPHKQPAVVLAKVAKFEAEVRDRQMEVRRKLMEKHRLAEIQVAEIKAKEIEQLRLSAEKLKAIKPGQAKEAHEAKLAKERAVKDAKEKKKGGKAKKEEIAMDGLEFDTSVDVRRMLDWYTRDKRYDRFRDANGYMSPLVLRKAKQIIEAEERAAAGLPEPVEEDDSVAASGTGDDDDDEDE